MTAEVRTPVIPRRSTRSAARLLILVVMIAAVLVPSVLTLYRCRMTDAVAASPCCERAARDDRGAAPDGPAVERERCCATVTIARDRAPLDVAARVAAPALPVLVGAMVPPPLRVAALSPASPSWTRAQFDTGPPVHLRVCSLLI